MAPLSGGEAVRGQPGPRHLHRMAPIYDETSDLLLIVSPLAYLGSYLPCKRNALCSTEMQTQNALLFRPKRKRRQSGDATNHGATDCVDLLTNVSILPGMYNICITASL